MAELAVLELQRHFGVPAIHSMPVSCGDGAIDNFGSDCLGSSTGSRPTLDFTNLIYVVTFGKMFVSPEMDGQRQSDHDELGLSDKLFIIQTFNHNFLCMIG